MTHAPTVVWSPRYEVDIGAHVFPTRKYRLVRDRLVERGVMGEATFLEAEPVDDEALLRVHTAEYLRKIREDDFSMSERWRLEVPFGRELAQAMRLCCGGTLLTARRALEGRGREEEGEEEGESEGGEAEPEERGARWGVAAHLGGGFHHAFADHGEGFCLLNDVAVAAAALLATGEVERAMVVDLDVHHGNGTAATFADEPRVFTFSMHQQANYPAVKPPSDLDVGLRNRTGDDEYLELLDEHLPRILEQHEPEVVFYLAGADPYREDQLGGLALTLEGLRRRDRMVLKGCREAGAAVAVVLAGGYARDTDDTVAIHAATVEEVVGG